jgi:folate-dependent phosphoribosylglycinamide formyltransferase PurN
MPYLKEARKKYGPGNIPRNCPERLVYEQEVIRLIKNRLGGEPDLLCLAGYDQWLTDWTVERYYPRILNVHPGDNTKGYDGLHWVPTAKAIIAGDSALRSTLFFVDKGGDTGPVLVQSAPLDIVQTLNILETKGTKGLLEGLKRVIDFAKINDTKNYADFSARANKELCAKLELICSNLQDALKVAGDWKIYPFAVQDLIARGRVEVEGRTVYIDRQEMPIYGYRPEEHRC